MKNRIRIARGTSTELGQSTAKAELGVPFYDITNKRLYIGKGTKDTDPMLKDYSEDDCVTSNRIADSNSSVKVGVTPSGALQPSETYVEVKGKDLYVENNVELAKTKTLYTDNISSADSTISGRVVNGTISNAVNSVNATNAIVKPNNAYSGFTQDDNNILKANGSEIISKYKKLGTAGSLNKDDADRLVFNISNIDFGLGFDTPDDFMGAINKRYCVVCTWELNTSSSPTTFSGFNIKFDNVCINQGKDTIDAYFRRGSQVSYTEGVFYVTENNSSSYLLHTACLELILVMDSQQTQKVIINLHKSPFDTATSNIQFYNTNKTDIADVVLTIYEIIE